MIRSPFSRTALSRAMTRTAALKLLVSNGFLGFGIVLLAAFMLLEVNGLATNPLIPAFAAFCIGCTAVLDRISFRLTKK
jgi:hypothetical protein